MITVPEFTQLCHDMVASMAGVKDLIIVVDESHTVNAIKDKPGPLLVGVLPSAQGSGKLDASKHMNTAMFFVVAKALTGSDPLDQYRQLQLDVTSAEFRLLERASDGCSMFTDLQPDGINIDPVFNEFGGYNGYLLTLVFEY